MVNLLITYYALINGIDPNLAFNLARIESGMNPLAISRTQDGGLFQLNKRYYRFHNPKWIFNIDTNAALALRTLGKLKKECSHKLNNTFVLCYNLGKVGAKKIKHPTKHIYFTKVNSFWRN